MEKQVIQLSRLVDMTKPAAVLEEVKYNFIQHYSIFAFEPVRTAFRDFTDLYEGRYPGYRSCNTRFHDQIHTTDALLAISRLIDGYNLGREKLPEDLVVLSLIATILHDAGYIQTKRDRKGTGAKYTLNHVERSIDFMKAYLKKQGFAAKEIRAAANMVSCTGLTTRIDRLRFGSEAERTLAFMLGSADLLGQMASRTYLERLLFLYREFREGHVAGYGSEYELLKNTLRFYDETTVRLAGLLCGVNRFMKEHFRARYRIDQDLYQTTIDLQIRYLAWILQSRSRSYRSKLRRNIG